MDFAVGIHDALDMRLLTTVPVCAPPKTPEWVRGKILFNTALPPMSRRRWVACSSCHPAGHAVFYAIEDKFVGAFGVHQLRALGRFPAVVLMAEPADIAKCRLHVERLGGRFRFVGKGGAAQPESQQGAGQQAQRP